MPNHPHGNLTTYKSRGCRCQPCRDACAAYERRRYREAAYGINNHERPATKARQHLQHLITAGMSRPDITKATGMSTRTIQYIVDGDRTTIKATTERAILQATPHTSPNIHVDATATRRRIQGLAVLGWGPKKVAETAGLSRAAVSDAANNQTGEVHASTAEAVALAASRLARKPLPQGRYAAGIRTRAAVRGWVSFVTWDAIDNPNEVPKTERPPRAYHGRVTNPDPELIERIQRLHRQGMSDPDIARTVGGRTASSVQKIRKRYAPQEDS